MEKICQCINSLILQESVYIEIRHGEDLSVYQFSDPTRECVYIYIYIYIYIERERERERESRHG